MMAPPDPRPILWIVVDDPALRSSLVAMLDGEPLDVVTEADPRALAARPAHHRPICALVDLQLAGRAGLDVVRDLTSRAGPVPVIAIAGSGDARSAVRAIKAGAMDFIETPLDRMALVALIEAGFARSRRRASSLDDRTAFALRLRRLTGREHEVFDRMVDGMPTKIIARELAISPRTVEIHRARVMGKLETHSMVELVRSATRADLMADESS